MGEGPKSDSPFLNDDTRRGVRGLVKECTLFYLHTTLSNPNPGGCRATNCSKELFADPCHNNRAGAHEISATVANIVQLVQQPGEIDQAIIVPIYIAGYMTDNLAQRQYLSLTTEVQETGARAGEYRAEPGIELVCVRWSKQRDVDFITDIMPSM